jgi:hypothetical protein
VLLDPSIDTAAAFSDGSVTGSIAKAGSFKGQKVLVEPLPRIHRENVVDFGSFVL